MSQLIFKNVTVYDEAINRINRIFDEFENVIVSFSGGKDSTVVLNLTLKIAEERNRLPLSVLFVDQEAEWQATIDYIKTVMYDKRVKPYWYQVPFKITNSTSANKDCLTAWGENEKWMREKDPISIKVNDLNTSAGTSHLDEFYAFFPKFIDVMYPNEKAAYLAGIRAQESPRRAMGMTQSLTYKDITWGRALNKNLDHYTFYPIYDWCWRDVWKAIHDNSWAYCKVYDYMYQHGVSLRNMRVSNLHHETAISCLFYMPEVEKETYDKLTERLNGISTANQMGDDNFFIKKLPYMFNGWKEYRDFLVDKIIPQEHIQSFKDKFSKLDIKYIGLKNIDSMYKVCVQSLIINDFGFVKLTNWETTPAVSGWRKKQRQLLKEQI